ncbi:hypothetical protein D3C77_472130 [compost metagenome]
MEEDLFAHRPKRHFANIPIPVAPEEFQVPGSRQDDALRMGILGAPVMQRGEHLFAIVLALQVGLNAEQRQQVDSARWHTGHDRLVIVQITPGGAKAGGQQHAQTPRPAFRDFQAPLRR